MMERAGKNIKRVIIIAAAALLALCMAGIIMVWADANNSEGTPLFKQVLGKAVNFGIVANDFSHQNDLQSNFATKTYSTGNTAHGVNPNLSGTNPGNFVIGKLNNRLQVTKGQSQYSTFYVTNEDQNKIDDSQNKEIGHHVTINTDYTQDQLNAYVDKLTNDALAQGATLASHAATYTKSTDQNNYGKIDTTDTTKYASDATIYLDGDAFRDEIQTGGKIEIHKLENQNIVFNFTKPVNTHNWQTGKDEVATSITFCEYKIQVGNNNQFLTTPDTQPGSATNLQLAQQTKHIFFNVRPSSKVKNVTFKNSAGIFLLDGVSADVEGSSSGWVVTNQQFSNTKGEWHNIYQDTENTTPGTPTTPTEQTGSLKLTKTSTGYDTPDNATFTITKQGETQPAKTVTYKQIKEGKGSYTVDLPIGTYNVKESGADVDGYTLKVDGTTTATVETGKTAEISLTNTYSKDTGSLTFTKKTAGDAQTPDSTQFTIKGPSGVVYQGTYGDLKKSDDSVTINGLEVGEYTVEETGEKVDNYQVTVTGNKQATVSKGQKANITLTNTYTKEQSVKGALRLRKQSKDGAAIAGTTYTLYKWNGTDVSQIGTVTRDQIEKTNKDQWTQEEESKKTDAHGVYTSKELDAGSTYAVMETEATDGYQRTANPAVFTVDTKGQVSLIQNANADGAAEIDKDGNMVWHETSVVLKVTKIDQNNKPVEGATLALYDGNKEIERWTTNGEAHQIATSLTAGKTYTLKEIDVPEGYEKAADQTITIEKKDAVGKTENIQSVSMTDQKKTTTPITLKVSKTNITGDKEVPGATIEVVDKTADKTVDTWTSDGKGPHDIGDKLEAGHTYTLKETSAPTGYAYTTDVTFTVDKDGTIKDANGKTIDNKTVLVKDEALALKVSKTDLTSGAEVKGAKIAVYDENNKVVDSWTSDGTEHDFGSKLTAGSSYKIKEDGAPAGYDYINTIKLSVGKDGKMTVTGTEGDFKYDAKTGKLTIQDKKLATKKYALKVRKTENIDKKDTNKRIRGSRYAMFRWTGQIAAADAQDNALLGASLRVSNVATTAAADQKDPYARFRDLTRADIMKAKDWKKINESDTNTNGEIEKSDNDITPGVYAVMEEVPPAGYQRTANPAIIRLNEDGSKTMISNANGAAELEREGAVQFLRWRETATNVEINKVDEKGDSIKGAVLAIYDKDGAPVETWTSDGTKHRITAKLVAGETYTLKEFKAPEGYEKAADETFTVESKDIVGIDQYIQSGIEMIDKTTPTTPNQPVKPAQTVAKGVKTGDPTTIGGLIALIAAAGAVTVLTVKRLRDAE